MHSDMADDIDDLLSCIETKMSTRVKTWDSDDNDGVNSPARSHSYTNKTSSDKCDRKYANIYPYKHGFIQNRDSVSLRPVRTWDSQNLLSLKYEAMYNGVVAT